jgi:hypothetical protein
VPTTVDKGKPMKQLIAIAKGTGAKVEEVGANQLDVLGRCDYQNRIIYINAEEDERKKIIILAHELGHWLTYLESRKKTYLRRNDREKMAAERGWYLLCNTGLARKWHIPKEEWDDINIPNYTNTNPDTKTAWT